MVIFHIFFTSLSMFWEVLWPLVLGFSLSAVVQAVVSHKALAKTLGQDNAKCFARASLFGIASSSCSYAAVALSRAIFQKGATFTSSMIFELASTNLVIELGVILFVLMGWQFAAAQWLGGIVMIILIALIFRFTLTRKLVQEAHVRASQGILGKMEGHAAMDMSISKTGSFWEKLFSSGGFTAIAHYFVMDWAAIWVDVALGFLIAGTLAVLVPHSLWQALFFTKNPTFSFLEGPLLGPLVAIISFVCSVGNVPLAAVLWQGGISFGGVVSFIFADLIVLPILDIYRKYYGVKVMLYILGTFYVGMVLAGYGVEILFSALHIVPTTRALPILSQGISWNYTTWLNMVFLIVTGVFVVRFITTDGLSMLKMMEKSEHTMHH